MLGNGIKYEIDKITTNETDNRFEKEIENEMNNRYENKHSKNDVSEIAHSDQQIVSLGAGEVPIALRTYMASTRRVQRAVINQKP